VGQPGWGTAGGASRGACVPAPACLPAWHEGTGRMILAAGKRETVAGVACVGSVGTRPIVAIRRRPPVLCPVN
jgi:hypothetical protein